MSVVASMFPPESTAQTGPVAADPPGEQRGDGRRARALDHELRPLGESTIASEISSSSTTTTSSSSVAQDRAR